MIRDPSDGSVREKPENGYWCPGCSGYRLEPCHHFHCPLGEHGLLKSESIASGLPPASIDPKRQAALEQSREWLKTYHQKPEDISP